MIATVLPFFGVIAGALLQYFFTRHLDRQRAQRDARTKAYTDYLKCVCESAHPNQMESTDGHELAARTADAKCRVCLYGSSQVVEAFAQFERLGAKLDTPQASATFAAMMQAMRQDSTGTINVRSADLQTILLGVDRPTQ